MNAIDGHSTKKRISELERWINENDAAETERDRTLRVEPLKNLGVLPGCPAVDSSAAGVGSILD